MPINIEFVRWNGSILESLKNYSCRLGKAEAEYRSITDKYYDNKIFNIFSTLISTTIRKIFDKQHNNLYNSICWFATIAQVVVRILGKDEVTSSSLVSSFEKS